MEELAKLLEPLEVATVFFCTERKVSISCIFPIMHNVFTSMDSEEGDSASIIAFKTAVRESIMRRWSLDGGFTTCVSSTVLIQELEISYR